jgi:membrane fusion protein, copper/silver efflux system
MKWLSLIAVLAACENTARPKDPHASHTAPEKATERSGFMLDRTQFEPLGLTTAKVEERDFSRTLRTVGVVAVDETRTSHVHTRVRGWIEGLDAQFVGRRVRKGENLASIYSQEVYAAELELASLMKSQVRSPELLEAARRRLGLWDVPRAVVEHVEQTGEPQRTFALVAPRAGTIIAKQAFEGLFVDPSIELYTISDLSRVWVLADIYEADVAQVQLGTEARLTVEGQATPIAAKVAFLSPTIDERTRTRKVRFDITGANLMPGAFVTVEMELALARGVAVPASSVIRTGERAVVFLLHGTHVQPQDVKLGARVGDYYRIDEGVKIGDVVATGAQFLLDSESQLRATAGTGGGHAHH